MSTLGDKLANTIDAMKASNIHDVKEQSATDLEQIKKDRSTHANWLHRLKTELFDTIRCDRVPLVSVDNYEFAEWLERAKQNSAPNQDLFDKFTQELKSERLRVEIKPEQSPMKTPFCFGSEVTVTVHPIRPGYRSADGDREFTPEELAEEDRPGFRTTPSTSYDKPGQQ